MGENSSLVERLRWWCIMVTQKILDAIKMVRVREMEICGYVKGLKEIGED